MNEPLDECALNNIEKFLNEEIERLKNIRCQIWIVLVFVDLQSTILKI